MGETTLTKTKKQFNYGISQIIEEESMESENIGRIIQRHAEFFKVVTLNTTYTNVRATSDTVYVGDFVMLEKNEEHMFISEVLPRKSVVSKKSNTTAKSLHENEAEQVLATNIDQLFIVIAVDQRFTISKFERYLLTFSQEDLTVNVIISKSDLTEDMLMITNEIELFYPHIELIKFSMYDVDTITNIKSHLNTNETSIFLGSSGAGKSTLINSLLNMESELTNEVRSDGKGKHTTTTTTIIPIPETESFVVDTPGFKGIDTTNNINSDVLFEEITQLEGSCKFNDCTHTHEPGCSVKASVENDKITNELYERFNIYQKKQKGYERHEQEKLKKKKNRMK